MKIKKADDKRDDFTFPIGNLSVIIEPINIASFARKQLLKESLDNSSRKKTVIIPDFLGVS
jgi:hypothetical protein